MAGADNFGLSVLAWFLIRPRPMYQNWDLAQQEPRAYTAGELGPRRRMVSVHSNPSTSYDIRTVQELLGTAM